MSESCTSCIKGVGEQIHAIRYGKTRQGKQRYRCMCCGRTFLKRYRNEAYRFSTNRKIATFLKEGFGTRSIARVLRISPATVQSRILKIASEIPECASVSYLKCCRDKTCMTSAL